ncbi:MAG: hypothetical protein IKU86_11720 [Thermoguttaceae bacterium]|nr:hypothetical protein [Thermoguttaceae bacterium]
MVNALTLSGIVTSPTDFYETLGNVGFVGDLPTPTPAFVARLEADVEKASATAVREQSRDGKRELVLCSCSSACGSNYSRGSCSCSSSCGAENYAKNGECACSSNCGSNYSYG